MALNETLNEHWNSLNRNLVNLVSPLMDPINAFNQSPIKGTFFIHFMIITCSMLIVSWLPGIFLLYNSMFFLCLLWSMHSKENPEPVQLAAIINMCSVLFDMVAVTVNYHHNDYRDGFAFSFILMVVNIMVRPFTSFILLRIHSDRDIRQTIYGGGFAGTSGSGIANPNHEQFISGGSGYQNLAGNNNGSDSRTNHNNNNPSSTMVSMPYQSAVTGAQLIDTK